MPRLYHQFPGDVMDPLCFQVIVLTKDFTKAYTWAAYQYV